jgi:hypothetical protein
MGASGWSYFVPYQPDIQAALDALRQQVFEAGAYYKPGDFMSFGFESGAFDNLPNEMREAFRKRIEDERSQPPPATIEELFERNGESGTHSILDITGVTSSPDFGTASPLTQDKLVELFATERPNRSMVEAKIDEVMNLRRRWEATYIIIYKNDKPDEIFFTGFSGD